MLINHFLSNSAARYPDKTALVCGEERVSYDELQAQVDRLAYWLLGQGFKPQDRVVIFLDNSIECVVSIFGVLQAGGIFVVLNPGMKAAKLSYILRDSGARFCILHQSKQNVLMQALPVNPALEHIISCPGAKHHPQTMGEPQRPSTWSWQEIASGKAPDQYSPGIIDIDLASIIYTSGSTGEPKGVMCSHGNMAAAATSISQYLEMSGKDIVLCALPLSFDYGLYQVLMSFMQGGTVVLQRSFMYPYQVLERLVQEKATGFPLVPTMAAMLLRMEGLDQFDFSSLRYITNTAAVLPVTHISGLRKMFPQVQIFSMYGLTECKRVSYLPPEDIDRKPGSVGLPIPNSDVLVLDEKGTQVPRGQVGELVVRGANVMQGYWNAPQETARVFWPGRYRGETLLYTGDLFQQDDQGYLYFVGRKDDQIKTRGERVSPREVENALCSMDGVAEAAVIGVPDELLGQAIKACVVLRDGTSLQERQVLRFCTQHLEPFMVPKYIQFCSELPRTPNGKVDKRGLGKM